MTRKDDNLMEELEKLRKENKKLKRKLERSEEHRVQLEVMAEKDRNRYAKLLEEANHSEKKLHDAERMLRTVLDTIPSRVFWKDIDSVYLGCNKLFAQDAGLDDPAEIVGKTDLDLPWSDRAELYRTDDKEVMLSGKPKLNYEEQQTTPKGDTVWLETSKIPLQDPDSIYGLLGIYEDITERKQKEEDLNLYRHMVETTGDPMFLIDDDDGCRMIYVNEAAVNHYNAPREEILTWRIPDWDPNFSYKDLPKHVEEVKKIKHLMIESIHRVKGGENIPVEISLNLTKYKGRTCHFGFFRNISERKRQAEELVNTKLEAEKANRAKSEFLSNMSHELRTPLNGILGFAQLMEMDKNPPLSEKHLDWSGEIRKSGNHLLHLIDEILDLSKIEAGKVSMSIEPIELKAILDDCINIIGPVALKEGINLNLDPSCRNEIVVRADAIRLKQVILNLLSNAVKYNREDGRIDVSCLVKEDKVYISVSDTGIGLSDSDLKKLFKPFERLDAENSGTEGTGIGLTITKQLVEMMGGRIDVESKKGVGSSFKLQLIKDQVRVSGEAAKASEAAGAEGILAGKKRTILYVEDNPANMRLVSEVLSMVSNMKLMTAHLPQLGLELAEAHHPDMVLLDINLPGMSGFEVLKEMRSMEGMKGRPIVAISANAMKSDIKKGMEAGFDAYLTKPINVPLLLDTIKKFLNA